MTRLERVVRWSLERPRLIAFACLWFAALALFSIRHERFDLLPNLAPAVCTIETDAPGLVAEQVEELVTGPIESGLNGADGVGAVHSESVQGLSIVTVRFAANADPYRARQAVAERLALVSASLPAGVTAPRLAPLTSAGADVIKIGFTSDKLDAMALRDLVQWTVRPRLLAATDVTQVAVYGGETRRIEVRARPADLSDSDLGFLDILNAVRRSTAVTGAGFIDTPNQRVLIEPRGQALTADDVSAGQIQTPGSTPVRIGDVSDVVEAPAPAFGDALISGKPGVMVVVTQRYGANTLETTHAVERELALLQPVLKSQGVAVRTDLDRPATFASAAVRGIVMDLAIGTLLIALVLIAFMRDLRAVLVSLVSIPLSVLAALAVLKLLGFSLNSMTLGGLAVGVGIAIDDSVIDVENILARLRDAEIRHTSRLEAVLAAALEVRAPVVYAAAALIGVLVPLLGLAGRQGALLAPLAVSIIVASIASLVVAVTITPSLSLIFLQHIEPTPEPRVLHRLKDLHGRWLIRVGARPAVVLLVSVVTVVVAVATVFLCRFQFLPSIHDGHLVVAANGPASTSLEAMRDTGLRMQGQLARISGVESVSQRIGRDATGTESWGPERSMLDLQLSPTLDASDQEAVAARVRRTLNDFAGLSAVVRSRFDAGQTSVQSGGPFQVTVYGQDLDALDAAAGKIAATLRAVPGAGDVQVQNQARAPVVRVDLNYSRLALYGLSSADVLDTVQAAFAGERVAQIYSGGRVVDLAVSAQANLRQDPEAVGNLLLRSTTGISAPLSTVANVYLTDGRAAIEHDGGLRRQVVTATPADPGRFEDLARRAIAAHVALPPGTFIEVSGDERLAAATRLDLAIKYAFALFAIAALLAISFDGRTGALILASTLFSLIGAAVAIAMLGGVLTIGVIAGIIALFGISMRGAILLFSRLEDLVLTDRAGWSLATVVQATRERLTPILMTALLIGLGLAPLAVHAGDAGREILGPMVIVLLGGLISGTIASLIALPAIVFALWRPAYARRARHHAG